MTPARTTRGTSVRADAFISSMTFVRELDVHRQRIGWIRGGQRWKPQVDQRAARRTVQNAAPARLRDLHVFDLSILHDRELELRDTFFGLALDPACVDARRQLLEILGAAEFHHLHLAARPSTAEREAGALALRPRIHTGAARRHLRAGGHGPRRRWLGLGGRRRFRRRSRCLGRYNVGFVLRRLWNRFGTLRWGSDLFDRAPADARHPCGPRTWRAAE